MWGWIRQWSCHSDRKEEGGEGEIGGGETMGAEFKRDSIMADVLFVLATMDNGRLSIIYRRLSCSTPHWLVIAITWSRGREMPQQRHHHPPRSNEKIISIHYFRRPSQSPIPHHVCLNHVTVFFSLSPNLFLFIFFLWFSDSDFSGTVLIFSSYCGRGAMASLVAIQEINWVIKSNSRKLCHQ